MGICKPFGRAFVDYDRIDPVCFRQYHYVAVYARILRTNPVKRTDVASHRSVGRRRMSLFHST